MALKHPVVGDATRNGADSPPVSTSGAVNPLAASRGNSIKDYRVYFNSKADAPNCWSVDAGTIESEIIVASIQFVEVNLVSRLNLSADNVRDPRAWFEVRGRLSIEGNHAVIEGD